MDLDGETRFSDVDDAADRGAAGSRQSLRRATSPGQMSSDAASDVERIEGTSAPTVIIIEDGVERRRTPVNVLTRRDTLLKSSTDAEIDFEKSAVYIAENSIEAARISNNYKFGLKKWKSHVTSRPLVTRSEIVQDLYADIDNVKDIKVTTIRPFNILYALLYGWWLALVYLIIGAFMYITVIGATYGGFCWRMAGYFIWPFGKYVHQIHQKAPTPTVTYDSPGTVNGQTTNSPSPSTNLRSNASSIAMEGETDALLYSSDNSPRITGLPQSFCYGFWKRPSSYLWILFGLIPLGILHALIFAISWFFVISIPTAKLNGKMLTKILFLPPDEVLIGNSGRAYLGPSKSSEIIMYSHQSVNLYYYKYTIDGVNIILANLLLFVILSIAMGYFFDNSVIGGVTKCVLSVLAIIPLTYYIGMAITSISAQSSFAVVFICFY
ncbi:hypothetical protein RRG08_028347 [Elysia crispata]|uniref:Inner membrane component domain-containing protein n=1 Tax=Elysia crispata TaxID=231223 RepID=A0AAE1AXN2_9GAST|nr:hypothetical protein RRG08_028347 [Elysia crispata]